MPLLLLLLLLVIEDMLMIAPHKKYIAVFFAYNTRIQVCDRRAWNKFSVSFLIKL